MLIRQFQGLNEARELWLAKIKSGDEKAKSKGRTGWPK